MTKATFNTLKAGDSLFVSYKGIRPCTFKNIRGNCAFIEFDNGDGTGKRLHRVLASTLIAKDDPRAPKPKAEPKKVTAPKSVAPKAKVAHKVPAEIEQALKAMNALREMIESAGYEVSLD